MDRLKYKNKHKKKNYDRIELLIPKGEKTKLKKLAAKFNTSLSDYIYKLICNDLSKNKSVLKENSFNENDVLLLEKMQVPKKYYEMIEQFSFDKDNGYYILLKQGYINDVTNSRTIYCTKTKEVRTTINKSHKVHEDVLIDGLDAITIEQLKRWQIPKKYYEMIESISVSKEDGYSIILKPGYINKFNDCRTITVKKANEFREIMKYTSKQ